MHGWLQERRDQWKRKLLVMCYQRWLPRLQIDAYQSRSLSRFTLLHFLCVSRSIEASLRNLHWIQYAVSVNSRGNTRVFDIGGLVGLLTSVLWLHNSSWMSLHIQPPRHFYGKNSEYVRQYEAYTRAWTSLCEIEPRIDISVFPFQFLFDLQHHFPYIKSL